MRPIYQEYQPKSILNVHKHVDGWLFDRYSAHPYVGCAFGCEFCCARDQRYLGGRDPAVADYPTPEGGAKPSGSWFKFGYPLGYVTDVVQNLEALTALGLRGDPRLAHALDLVRSKQDARGRWKMAYTYNGKMWAGVETPGKPSKWVTLRALSAPALGCWLGHTGVQPVPLAA